MAEQVVPLLRADGDRERTSPPGLEAPRDPDDDRASVVERLVKIRFSRPPGSSASAPVRYGSTSLPPEARLGCVGGGKPCLCPHLHLSSIFHHGGRGHRRSVFIRIIVRQNMGQDRVSSVGSSLLR